MNATEFRTIGNPMAPVAILHGRLNPARIAVDIGKAVQEQRRKHLLAYGAAHPNKLGGPSTGYYNKAAGNTTMAVNGAVASVVTSAVGFVNRIYGGVITPKRGRYLAIPVDAQAHGRQPRSMSLTPVIRYVGGRPRMVALQDASGRRMFSMKERVRQIGDPAVVPDERQVQEVIDETVEKAIA